MDNHNKPLSNYEDENRIGNRLRGDMVFEANNQEKNNNYDLEHITSRHIHTLGRAALYDDLSYLEALDKYGESKPTANSKHILVISDISPQENKLLEWEEDAPQVITGYAKHVLGIRDFANVQASAIASTIRQSTTKELDRLRVIDPEYYREKLELLNQGQRERLNKVLNTWSLPGRLEEVKRKSKTGEIDFLAAVLNKDDLGNYTMDSKAFRGFLRWHNQSHRDAESDFVKKVPELKLSYEKRLQELVRKGRLPNTCFKGIRRIDDVPVFISDGFGTISGNHAGYYDGEKIVIDPRGANDGDSASKTLDHELTHACVQGSGITYVNLYGIDEKMYKKMNPDGRPKYSLDTPDGSYRQFDSHRCLASAVRAVMEGCCEHITRMLSSNEDGSRSSYGGEREMVEFIIRLSEGKLNWDDFVSAFSANDLSEFNSFIEKVIRATEEKNIWLYCGAAFLDAYGNSDKG